MKELTLQECLCIIHNGWSTEPERELYEKARRKVSEKGNELFQTYLKDKTEPPSEEQISDFVDLLIEDKTLGINEDKKKIVLKTISWLNNL